MTEQDAAVGEAAEEAALAAPSGTGAQPQPMSAASVRLRLRAHCEDEAQRRAYVARLLDLTNRHYLLFGALKLLFGIAGIRIHVLKH